MSKSSVNQTLSHHMPNGTVYIKVATVPETLAANAQIQVGLGGNRTFIAGTDVFHSREKGWAYSFAEAINANPATLGEVHTKTVPNGVAFARAIGNQLILIGRVAGDNFATHTANGFPPFSTVFTGARADSGSSGGGGNGNKSTSAWRSHSVTVTSDTGQALANHLAIEVLIQNQGPGRLLVRRTTSPAGASVQVEDGDSLVLDLIENTNEVTVAKVTDAEDVEAVFVVREADSSGPMSTSPEEYDDTQPELEDA